MLGLSLKAVAFAGVMSLSLVGVVADYFLKQASQCDAPWRSPWFSAGTLLYASTAFVWVYVMRHLNLANIGVIYSVTTALLITILGVVAFRETLTAREIAGLALGLASLLLLKGALA